MLRNWVIQELLWMGFGYIPLFFPSSFFMWHILPGRFSPVILISSLFISQKTQKTVTIQFYIRVFHVRCICFIIIVFLLAAPAFSITDSTLKVAISKHFFLHTIRTIQLTIRNLFLYLIDKQFFHLLFLVHTISSSLSWSPPRR